MRKGLALFVMVMLLLTACSSGDGGNKSNNGNKQGANNNTQEQTDKSGNKAGDKEVEKIIVWAWDPNFNIAALDVAKEYYKADNPNFEMEVINNAQADIVSKLNTTLSSNSTKGLPNIVLIEDYRAPSFLQAYPDAFHPLTDVFEADDFVQYKVKAGTLEGENYGLPFDSGVTGLYVRTDYLEQAGYTTADLQNITWSEYIEIGKKVKEATGKHWISLDPNDLGIIRIMMQSAGSWYLEEDGITPFIANNEAFKEAFEVYKAMIDTDIAKIHTDWSQLVANYNSGDVVSTPTGNWFTPSIMAAEDQAGKWAIVPLPRLDHTPNAVNASSLGGSSFYVLNIEGKEVAADFLAKTFGSSVELYQDLVKKIGAIGTYGPATEGEAYKASNAFFQDQKIITDFSDWSANIPKVNYGMHTYAIEDLAMAELQNFLNNKDIDKVLADLQKQADTQIR